MTFDLPGGYPYLPEAGRDPAAAHPPADHHGGWTENQRGREPATRVSSTSLLLHHPGWQPEPPFPAASAAAAAATATAVQSQAVPGLTSVQRGRAFRCKSLALPAMFSMYVF